MALHIDHRPESFEDYSGNEATVRAVRAFLSREDRNRVVLISGPSGCGKTTLARLIASEVLGLDRYADDSISDYLELNASDFRGIDTVRELKNKGMFRPAAAKCRVFMFDECHRLTPDAQEALLKQLEQAAKHLFYIFCTTEPGKLKDTFRRRCTHFEVKPLKTKEVEAYLEEFCAENDFTFGEETLNFIAGESQGSLGIALGLLDRCVGVEEEDVEKIVRTALEEKELARTLARLLLNPQTPWAEVAKCLSKLKEENTDAEGIRRVLLGYAQAVLLNPKGKTNKIAYAMLDSFRNPTYDMGFPAITLGCFEIMHSN